uniref:protein disulfide-isomerase n=1 Tax=Amphiprion percula TaxID=161767 RepID=A0A3P8RSH8_AMPPE
EKDVMVLHINNFERALSENQYLLVEFYAPWCGHCRELEPIYAEAAEKLKKEEPPLRLAKVDAIEEKEIADEFDVGSFPTMKLFLNGDRKQPVDFTGKRTVMGIMQWMKRRTGPGAPDLDSVDAAAQFIDSHNITVVGFFDVCLSVSTIRSSSNITLGLRFDDGRADFTLSEDGTLDKSNLTTFIKTKQSGADDPFQPGGNTHTDTHMIRHEFLMCNHFEIILRVFKETTTVCVCLFVVQMLFIKIDVTEALSHVLNYFGVSEKDAPTARIIDMDSGKKFSIASGDLTVKSLQQLCQEVVEGSAKPYYRSEDVPEDWDKGPVKVLVGKNFESVALDPTKNVFVECSMVWTLQELGSHLEELGEKYMDATANEVESLKVDGFPTIKYSQLVTKRCTQKHKHTIDLETFSKFLDGGGVLPEEKSDEDEDSEEDDDDDSEVCDYAAIFAYFSLQKKYSSTLSSHFTFSVFQEVDESDKVSANDTSKDEL